MVVFGEAMLRLSPPSGERLRSASSWAVHVAGAEANVAVDLAMLGVPVAWVGALPASPLGLRAASALRAAGVDLGLVEWVPGARIGLFLVDHGTGARATSVLYDRADSAFARAARWPAGGLGAATFAVVSGVTPAISQRAREAAGRMAREAAAAGVRLCVDVNYRARLWSPAQARAALEPLLRLADVVVCSEADAVAVFDVEPDPETFRARFAPAATMCVVTRSERGVLAASGDGLHDVPALETTVVDRLGMGDAFLAGLLHGLLEDCGHEAALRRGVTLAALKSTIGGDHAAVDAEELRAAAGGERRRVLR